MNIYEARRIALQRLIDSPRYQGRQRAFAQDAGISQSYVTRVLQDPEKPGAKRIGEDVAQKIEDALGLPFGSLLMPGWQVVAIDEESIPEADASGLLMYPNTFVSPMAWEELKAMRDRLPDVFSVRAPDDALHPRLKSGQTARMNRRLEPRAGDCVLIRDKIGGMHLRIYRPGVGRWEAHAAQDSHPVMHSESDGLEVLAVLEMVDGRWG